MRTNRTVKNKILTSLVLSLLLLNTFAIFFIQSPTHFMVKAQPSYIFQNGFEEGNFSAWTATTGSPSVETTQPFQGIYSMWNNASGEYVSQTFGTQTDVYLQAYFYSNTFPDDDNDYIELIHLRYSTTDICYVEIHKTSGQLKLNIDKRLTSGNVGYLGWTGQTGVWYGLQIRFFKHETNGGYELWVDGESVVSQYGLNTTGVVGCDRGRVGARLASGFTPDMYVDNVKVDDEFIDQDLPPMPTAYNIACNEDRAGFPVTFSVRWVDYEGLSGYIFSTNNTGTWQNDTWTGFSGTPQEAWSNVTKTFNSTFGLRIGWRIYANDTDNNLGDSGTQIVKTLMRSGSTFEVQFEYGDITTNYSGEECDIERTDPANYTLNSVKTLWGQYCLEVESDDGGPDGRNRIHTEGDTITNTAEVRAKINFYIESFDWSTNIELITFWTADDGNGFVGALIVEPNPPTGRLFLKYYKNWGGAGGVQDKVDVGGIYPNMWHYAELYAKMNTTEGVWQTWFDDLGVVHNHVGVDMSNITHVDEIEAGINILGQSGCEYTKAYFDGYVCRSVNDDPNVATNVIGHEPCDNGAIMYQNQLQKNVGDKYLSNAVNASCINLQWYGSNNTLRTTFRNTTTPTTGKAAYYWQTMTNQVKIKFSNGTIVNAQDYYDGETKIITISWTFGSEETILIYRIDENHKAPQEPSGWSPIVRTVWNLLLPFVFVLGVGLLFVEYKEEKITIEEMTTFAITFLIASVLIGVVLNIFYG